MRIEEYDSICGQLTVGTKEKWMRALVLAVFHDGWVLGYRDRPNRVLLRRWCLVVDGKGYRSSQAPCSLVRITVGTHGEVASSVLESGYASIMGGWRVENQQVTRAGGGVICCPGSMPSGP